MRAEPWCGREDMTTGLDAARHTLRDICEIAVGFELNDRPVFCWYDG